MALIASITRVTLTQSPTTGNTLASIHWLDIQGREGVTRGRPKVHPGIDSLIAKASRQGVRVVAVSLAREA